MPHYGLPRMNDFYVILCSINQYHLTISTIKQLFIMFICVKLCIYRDQILESASPYYKIG